MPENVLQLLIVIKTPHKIFSTHVANVILDIHGHQIIQEKLILVFVLKFHQI